MIKFCGGNRGQIAPLTAVILAALVLLTATVAVLAASQKRAGVFYNDRIQAYYTAEDGVEEVLALLFNDWEGTLGLIPSGANCAELKDLGRPGQLEVKGRRQDVSGAVELRLETKGYCRQVVRNVLFKARLYPPLDFGSGITAEEFDINEDEDPGEQDAGETPPAANSADHYVLKPAPVIEPHWFWRRADRVIDGDAVLDHGRLDGRHFVDGNLSVTGGRYDGRAIIFVDGRIDISGDYHPRGDACIVLVTPGDIDLAPGCAARVLVVSGGEVRLADGSCLQGGLIAHRLCAGAGARAEPDEGLINRAPPVFTRAMQVDYWGDMYHAIYGHLGG